MLRALQLLGKLPRIEPPFMLRCEPGFAHRCGDLHWSFGYGLE